MMRFKLFMCGGMNMQSRISKIFGIYCLDMIWLTVFSTAFTGEFIGLLLVAGSFIGNNPAVSFRVLEVKCIFLHPMGNPNSLIGDTSVLRSPV